MPSEFSLFRKIQVVLDIAKAVEVGSWRELNSEVISQRPPNFLTKQYDKKHDAMMHDVSQRGVRKAINISRMLQLIDDKGHITDVGRRALRSSIFGRVLSEQVQQFLEGKGIQIRSLGGIINKSLHSNPLVMPTSSVLWEGSGSKIPLLLFSQMLTLLSQCGVAESSQRKIYLRFNQ
jgi:hypothetical protein